MLCKIAYYTEIANQQYNSQYLILSEFFDEFQLNAYTFIGFVYLAIYNVNPHDGGTYLCTTGIQQLYMTIVFRGTQNKLEKCSQTKPINVYAIVRHIIKVVFRFS
jgi:hypothetical protein